MGEATSTSLHPRADAIDASNDGQRYVRMRDLARELESRTPSAVPASTGWQPISTAPKDCNIILTDGKVVGEGGWMTDVEQGADYEGHAGMAGWWCIASIPDGKLTHWMPLPNPSSPSPAVEAPIDMLLFCPRCQQQHIDAPEPEKGWTNPPHATHTCKFCGLNWRPSNDLTNGVRFIEVQEGKHLERINAAHPGAHDLARSGFGAGLLKAARMCRDQYESNRSDGEEMVLDLACRMETMAQSTPSETNERTPSSSIEGGWREVQDDSVSNLYREPPVVTMRFNGKFYRYVVPWPPGAAQSPASATKGGTDA